MYVPLRVHGHHSLLSGVDDPATLIGRARELGIAALALADVDTLSGSVEFLQAARAATPFHAIVAAEISDPSGEPGRIVALVEDARGYANLCKLVSARALGADPGVAGARLDGPDSFRLVESAVRHQHGLIFLVDHPRLLVRLAGRVDPRSLFAAISPAALRVRAAAADERTSSTTRNAHLALREHEPAVSRTHLRRRDAGATGRDDDTNELEPAKTPPPARPAAARELVEAARAVRVATLAVPDVWYARPASDADHRLRIAIKHNALLSDLAESWTAPRPAHLLGTSEMQALYAGLPEVDGPFERARGPSPGVLARTLEVAARCRFTPELGGILFPKIELPPGENAYSQLAAQAFTGAARRYRPLRPEVVRRLDYELSTIDRLGFAPYFLLVKRIADFAREQEIPCVGRGSAADSLVAYCLELTDADPLRYDLIFERFLNPARSDRPDIDLDFCWRRRDEVLEHVYALFGSERTAMISTLNRCGLRSAFREAALVEGLPPAEINRWSRRLPYYLAAPRDAFDGAGGSSGIEQEEPHERDELVRESSARESSAHEPSIDESSVHEPAVHEPDAAAMEHAHRPDTSTRSTSSSAASQAFDPVDIASRAHAARLPVSLRANPVALALAATPEAEGFPFDDRRWQRVLHAAAGLLDAPRHHGLHPGGVVVAPGPITDFVSCRRAAKGVVVTELDKDAVEAIGLVKMDLLGNRALTVIDDCVRALRSRGIEVDLASLPEDDPRTAQTLREGRTLGCFQVESPGMRNLLVQTGASTMDDVIQAVALIRPGPAGSGMKDAYVRRFRKLEPPTPPHPRLAELLWGTHGVMLYQEDVMQVAARIAGMDLAEADLLRRALQKREARKLGALCDRFLAGALEQGVTREEALRVWDLVANFASFGFCKAHAVTYGRIAYRAVWLKTHHPAVYLASFLASETGYYAARVYVEEARRLGVAILGPDVNKSGRSFTTEWSARGIPALRIGLGEVKGLSQRTLDALIGSREEHGPFLSLPDLLERSLAHTDEADHLIQCGACDGFDRTRPELLWRLHLLRAPERRPPRASELTGGEGLDPEQLAACRATPRTRTDDALRAARASSGGWHARSLGLGNAELEKGESAALFPEREAPALALPRLPDHDPKLRGRIEYELLGLSVHEHPVRLFPCPADARIARAGEERPEETDEAGSDPRGRETDRERRRYRVLRPVNPKPCAELARYQGGRITLRGWPAASRHVRTADGRTMRFLTLEDESGIAEIVLFPDVYERDGAHLAEFGVLCVTGVVENQMGSCTLHAERVW